MFFMSIKAASEMIPASPLFDHEAESLIYIYSWTLYIMLLDAYGFACSCNFHLLYLVTLDNSQFVHTHAPQMAFLMGCSPLS